MEHSASRNRSAETMTEQQLRDVTIGDPVAINGPVRLVPYDPAWPTLYERESERLRSILGDRVVQLDHIGSTAVPGLTAKPIIDIQLLVKDSGDEPSYASALIGAGYNPARPRTGVG